MNTPVEVLCLAPHKGRTDLSFNGKTTALIEAPFEDGAEQAIQGVVARLPFQVVLQPRVALNRDDGTNAKLAWGEFFSPCGCMGPGWKR